MFKIGVMHPKYWYICSMVTPTSPVTNTVLDIDCCRSGFLSFGGKQTDLAS